MGFKLRSSELLRVYLPPNKHESPKRGAAKTIVPAKGTAGAFMIV